MTEQTRKPKSPSARGRLPLIGWREWLALPELGIERIKAKIDTGARTSALHAFDLEEVERGGERWLRFNLHPRQRDARWAVAAEARLIDRREVRSSSGRVTMRPVIRTVVQLGAHSWPIEVTLVRRDLMGFRMLLGRQAVRRRFLVDPGASYKAGADLPTMSGANDSATRGAI